MSTNQGPISEVDERRAIQRFIDALEDELRWNHVIPVENEEIKKGLLELAKVMKSELASLNKTGVDNE